MPDTLLVLTKEISSALLAEPHHSLAECNPLLLATLVKQVSELLTSTKSFALEAQEDSVIPPLFWRFSNSALDGR